MQKMLMQSLKKSAKSIQMQRIIVMHIFPTLIFIYTLRLSNIVDIIFFYKFKANFPRSDINHFIPKDDFKMNPATNILHYGQGIFEGVKAYKNEEGKITTFRIDENIKRMNRSAERLCMPTLDADVVLPASRSDNLSVNNKEHIHCTYFLCIFMLNSIKPQNLVIAFFVGAICMKSLQVFNTAKEKISLVG